MKDGSQKFSFNTEDSLLIINEIVTVGDNEDVDVALKAKVTNSDKITQTVKDLSPEKKKKLENEINKVAVYDQDRFFLPFLNLEKAIQTILSEPETRFLPSLYKNTDPSQEFAVSRWVADRMSHLQKLLPETKRIQLNDETHLISAEVKDSRGNSIRLEHRFKATNEEEADKLFLKIVSQLAGIQIKIWLACWKICNESGRHTYLCKLTKLMKEAFPGRRSSFSSQEKQDFFEHLKSLEQTKFIFSVAQKKKRKNSKEEAEGTVYHTFEIPLLQIPERVEEENAASPEKLTIVVMNLLPNPGKMAFVGAPIKNRTLELHADDVQLGLWVQTRKNQLKDAKTISIDLEYLFQLAGLEGTAKSNKSQARKSLKTKLQRLVDKGILMKLPESLGPRIQLPIR